MASITSHVRNGLPTAPAGRSDAALATPGGEGVGRANVVVAWWMMAAGMAGGAVAGLWSFGGPARPPAGFVDYNDTPRRLVRLAHIAAVALPLINLHYVPWMRRARWGGAARRAGCRLLLFGTLALPLVLSVTAFWRPALYALPLPVCALVAAVTMLAIGVSRSCAQDGR